jgi:hypothetical protein
MNNIRLWANFYHNMGFNITHIIAKLNNLAKNPYKSATNDRFVLQNRRQELSELNLLDWESSDGIGVVLGFNSLRAIDFDFYCYEWENYEYQNKLSVETIERTINSFIKKALNKLSLPSNYEWVVRSPNGGFHILIYSDALPFSVEQNKTKAFIPNKKYYEKYGRYNHDSNYVPYFSHIELRWDKHLVLPPSINQEKKSYKFRADSMPKTPPLIVQHNSIINLLNEFCYDEIENKVGYNLSFSHYEEEAKNDEDWTWNYGEGEFLDMLPIVLNKTIFKRQESEVTTDLALSYENNDIIEKFKSEYGIEDELAKKYFSEVKKFLYLCAKTSDRLAPSDEIDKIWHTFILFTKDYRYYCMNYLGKFIDHVPEVKKDEEDLFEAKENCLLNTLNHYQIVFGELNNEVWQVPFKNESEEDCSNCNNCSSCNNDCNNCSSCEGRGSQPSCVFTGNCFDCTDSGYSCVGENPNDL